MTIPASQLESWARYPTPIRSAWAHAAIKASIHVDGRYRGHSVEVYVQGSYRNHVNTRWDSDVDIVAELRSVSFYETSWLHPWERAAFWRSVTYSDYDYQQFRTDLLESLRNRFGGSVVPHSKAIEVRGTWNRLKVDVLPAMRYQQIYAFEGGNVSSNDGIVFWTADGRLVVNWPQEHFDGGVTKNEASGGEYKPTVRMFKNARRTAVERGLMRNDLAPSYFLQCLLWNVPDELFGLDRAATYCAVVNWLVQYRSLQHQFRCQNGVDLLFGVSPEQWNLNDACATVDILVGLWNEWP